MKFLEEKKQLPLFAFFNYLFFHTCISAETLRCRISRRYAEGFENPDKSDDYLNRVRTWQTMKRQSLTLFCSNTNVFNCNGINPRRLFSDSNNKNLQIEGMIKYIKPATARKA